MEPGNPLAPDILPPAPTTPEAVPGTAGDVLPVPEFAPEAGAEKAQAEIVKNTQTPMPVIVKNTETDNVAPVAPFASDPAKINYEEATSDKDAITKAAITALRKIVIAPIKEGKDAEANANYQGARAKQLEIIRKKGTVS